MAEGLAYRSRLYSPGRSFGRRCTIVFAATIPRRRTAAPARKALPAGAPLGDGRGCLFGTYIGTGTCVDAPGGCKQNLSSAMGMWSGADVCPASSCGEAHAAGPYGSLRIGSITLT